MNGLMSWVERFVGRKRPLRHSWVLAWALWGGVGQVAAQSIPWEWSGTWWRAADTLDGRPGVPVGEWGLEDAAWREEIPWLDGVVVQPGGAASADWVVQNWDAVPVDAGDLTDRQRAILMAQQGGWEELAESFFVPGGKERGAFFHWAVPALRWNAAAGGFERLVGASGWVDFASGAGGGGERWQDWPETSPLAGEGVFRIAVARSGVYQLDADFWGEAGVDHGQLDPRRVVIYGNGGLPLPMSNAVERPLGVRTVAAQWRGAQPDVWGEDDALFFYAQGPDASGWDAVAQAYRHARHPW
ncbi:MAG: hypothetical protein RJA19_1895, partial [Bacteroidota bacterium]